MPQSEPCSATPPSAVADVRDAGLGRELALDARRRLAPAARRYNRSSPAATLNVTIDSVRSPRSTRATFARLCVNNAASTSSSIDSAICDVASAKRKRPRFLPPNARALPPCSARTGSVATSFAIGSSANTSVASAAIAKAAATAREVQADAAGRRGPAAPTRRSRAARRSATGKLATAAQAGEQQRFDGQERDEPATARRRATRARRSRRCARRRARTSGSRGSRSRSAGSSPSPRKTPRAASARAWGPGSGRAHRTRATGSSRETPRCRTRRATRAAASRAPRRRRRSRGTSRSSAACACSSETPGSQRARTRRRNRRAGPRSAVSRPTGNHSSVNGAKTSGRAPGVVPTKPRGATPTIVSGWPPTTSVLPSTAGIRGVRRLPIIIGEHDGRRRAVARRPARRARGRAPARRRAPRKIAARDEHAEPGAVLPSRPRLAWIDAARRQARRTAPRRARGRGTSDS